MYSPLRFQLLALVFLNQIVLILALPTAASLSLPVTPANNSAPLTSVNFSQNVALGIAAAQRAYPKIVPRLYYVFGVLSGGPQSLPFMIDSVVLQLHITYPKFVQMGLRDRSTTWFGPVERDDAASFNRPEFDWARLPLSFENAQLKVYSAENIPNDRKEFSEFGICVLQNQHPTLPIGMGELMYSFINRNEHGGIAYIVFVVASSGEVFLDDRQQATAAVQTT